MISTAPSSTKRFTTTPAPRLPQEATVAEIRRLIAEAGRVPVERDTLYRQVDRQGSRWQSGQFIDVAALAGLAPDHAAADPA